jgi:hypothetical protein
MSDFLAFKRMVPSSFFTDRKRMDSYRALILRGPHDELIENSTYLGGMSGGSCYGGEASYFSASGERDMGPVSLERLVLQFFPDIKLSSYRKLESSIVREGQETKREYYGNTSEYAVYYFSLYSFWSECQKLMLTEDSQDMED